MECKECGKKVKVCFRSNNQRYKIYICRGCKLKEDRLDTTIIIKRTRRGKMNKELIEQLEHNEKIIQDEINWINEMLGRLSESRKYIEKVHKNKYYINQFLKVYNNLIPFFEIRLKELGVSSHTVHNAKEDKK